MARWEPSHSLLGLGPALQSGSDLEKTTRPLKEGLTSSPADDPPLLIKYRLLGEALCADGEASSRTLQASPLHLSGGEATVFLPPPPPPAFSSFPTWV